MTKSGALSLFFWRLMKLPRIGYSLGFGPIMGRMVLLLTTAGRRTGRPHVTPLQYEEENNVIYVASARGVHADWFRNIMVHPHVEVQVKNRCFSGLAEPITDPVRIADFLALRIGRHPWMMALLLRIQGLPWHPGRTQLEEFSEKIALAAITPLPERVYLIKDEMSDERCGGSVLAGAAGHVVTQVLPIALEL